MSSSQRLMGPGGGLLNGTGSSQLSAKTNKTKWENFSWDCEDMLCNSVSTGCLCWTDCSCHDLDLRQYRGSHINFLVSPGRDMKVPLPENKMPGTCCGHPYVPNYWTPNTFTSSLPWVGTVFSMDSRNPGLWSLDPNVGSWQRLQISTAAFSKPWSAPALFSDVDTLPVASFP